MDWSGLLYGRNIFRYQIVPIVFLGFFTLLIQVLGIWGQHKTFSCDLALENLWGDSVSWALTLVFYAWAFLSLKLSSKIYYGPETIFGYRPAYTDNGFKYYLVSSMAFLVVQAAYPGFSVLLYEKFPKMMSASSILALLLCAWLYIKGKYRREHKGDIAEAAPMPYEFYRGMELHPRILGVDSKQFTNCRFGMMTWQIFLAAFAIAAWQTTGFNWGVFMHLLLQTIYIAKFFWWETGYFNTIDMMTDRGGYYLCWGCLVFLPAYFCFPASYVVESPSKLSDTCAIAIGAAGILFTYIEYTVDMQKHSFRSSWPSKNFKIWGKPATFILAEYKDNKGQLKKSPLLTSGFWGIVRHMNYTLELLISFTISATLGFDHGIWTFLYFIFIAPLLFHRILRDDAKCREKYGKDWEKYKQRVKFVLIPGIY